MRTHRFRHWDKKTGAFVYFTFGEVMTDFARAIYESICIDGGKFERFTGFQDKNGTDIWEGDKYGYSCGDPSIFTVAYSEKSAMFGIRYDDWDEGMVARIDSHTFNGTVKIGNIHNK